MLVATRIDDFLKYSNLGLRLAMVEPYTIHNRWNRGRSFLRRAWFIFGVTNLVYQIFGMIIYLFLQSDAETNDNTVGLLLRISETGAILGLCVVGSCKMCILFWYKKEINSLFRQFESVFPNISSKGQPDSISESGKASQRLMQRTTIFFLFAYAYYNLLPIVEIAYELLLADQSVKYKYQSNTWYPWNALQTGSSMSALLNFLASYICQMQASLTGVAFIMAGEFTLCFFISQMQMHFEYLGHRFETLKASDGNANNELKRLIEYHSKLINFSDTINKVFETSFAINFATAAIAICLMGFSMVMISVAHAFKYSVGLLSFLVFMLFICHNGTELTSSSIKLGLSVFYGNWYEGDASYRRMIQIVVMRCKKPVYLKAYKIMNVSMEAYMAILQLSYRLFTFFRTMM